MAGSSIVPCKHYRLEENADPLSSATFSYFIFQKEETLALKSIHAASFDSEDDLVKQYRLDSTLPPMPLGVVETININFMLKMKSKMTEVRGAFRLRIHSAARYYDFPFSIKLELIDDEKIASTKNHKPEPTLENKEKEGDTQKSSG